MMKDQEQRNWSELPPELTSLILLRLGAVDRLENAQKVCREWRRVSKDPLMWRKIDMRNQRNHSFGGYNSDRICCQALDRSEGGLVEINVGTIGSDSLLTYIADRSSNLLSLGVAMCYPLTYKGLVNAVAKLPLLEELEITQRFSKLNLKDIGHSCPRLKALKLIFTGYMRLRIECDDDDALAIAESMPQLRHLQLIGNGISDTGLNAILDACSQLERLDLRCCFHVNIVADLKKRCLETIKDFRHPYDSTADHPLGNHLILLFIDFASDDEYGLS